MKRILSVFLIVMLLAGCSQKSKQVEKPVVEPNKSAVEQNMEVANPPAEVEKESNLFDARKVKSGDQVAGLRVTKVEVHNAADDDYDAYVDFEGEVTVSGTFKHNLNDEFLDNEITFNVDEESAALLPMLAHDRRNVWFMFMNHDEAEKALGVAGTEGKATVTIKNYSIKYAHTEIWNTADLVKAEKK
ncbi:MAG TPA: membrane lipoprotein lipid attachment site-containing protein [Clostridia bacterium]|nr:membrane lipoprotein lipid attachment site-containing protein [Clostridia bacterium]